MNKEQIIQQHKTRTDNLWTQFKKGYMSHCEYIVAVNRATEDAIIDIKRLPVLPMPTQREAQVE